LPQKNLIVLALALPIAAWNWLLQSEKAILAGASAGLADELGLLVAELELAALLVRLLVGGAGLLPVHAVPVSSTAAARADRRTMVEVGGTHRGYRPQLSPCRARRRGWLSRTWRPDRFG
jgi:hypothetical protein